MGTKMALCKWTTMGSSVEFLYHILLPLNDMIMINIQLNVKCEKFKVDLFVAQTLIFEII